MKRAFLIAACGLVLAAFGAACNDDEADSESSASQESIDVLSERVQHNEMFAAFISIGNIPLHDMDEALNETGTIEPSYVPDTREFVRIMGVTDWSTDLSTDAETLRQSGIDLLAALEDADVEAAKPLATEVHEGWHDFSDMVLEETAGDLPPEEGGPEPHGEEEGTPVADETPDDHGSNASPEATP
jgi:hypothetical protein